MLLWEYVGMDSIVGSASHLRVFLTTLGCSALVLTASFLSAPAHAEEEPALHSVSKQGGRCVLSLDGARGYQAFVESKSGYPQLLENVVDEVPEFGPIAAELYANAPAPLVDNGMAGVSGVPNISGIPLDRVVELRGQASEYLIPAGYSDADVDLLVASARIAGNPTKFFMQVELDFFQAKTVDADQDAAYVLLEKTQQQLQQGHSAATMTRAFSTASPKLKAQVDMAFNQPLAQTQKLEESTVVALRHCLGLSANFHPESTAPSVVVDPGEDIVQAHNRKVSNLLIVGNVFAVVVVIAGVWFVIMDRRRKKAMREAASLSLSDQPRKHV